MAELSDVLVNHEAVIFRRSRIYAQSFAREMDAQHYRRPSRYAAFLVKNVLRRSVRVQEALWIVDNFSPDNYFHWMTECLPRLASAENMASVLLLPSFYRHNAYVGFTLQAFPKVKRIGWVGLKVKVRVGKLYCPPRPPSGRYTAQLPEVSRRIASLADPGGPRRVYITRENASRRRLTNHKDVGQLLRRYGFEPLHVDPGRPKEQIAAVRSAECLVAVHGAELTNLMFMPPRGHVIELRHSRNDVFF